MQKYKQAALAIAFLTLVFSGGLTVGLARTEDRDGRNQGEKEEMILTSFENGDYDTWRRLLGQKGKISEVITKEEFQTFIEAREKARSGRYEEAILIAEKLENKLKSKLFVDGIT